jgi:hypothetical protein
VLPKRYAQAKDGGGHNYDIENSVHWHWSSPCSGYLDFILSLFKISSLDYRYVGRWIAHFSNGNFVHNNIMVTLPVPAHNSTKHFVRFIC